MGILLVLAVCAAVLNLYAVRHTSQRLEDITKPATLILISAWFALVTRLDGFAVWFGLGLLLSLVGDILLLRPDRRFKAGLAAFLLAHTAYIVGFNTPIPPLDVFGLGLAIVYAIMGGRIYRRLAAGLAARGQSSLRLPVLVYSLALSVMFLSATLTLFRPDWTTNAALLIFTGAALFYFSDVLLAFNRFVAPMEHGRLMNMTAYHLGQLALALGVAVQLSV
jgi:uncharacterized membrane protein YhhN